MNKPNTELLKIKPKVNEEGKLISFIIKKVYDAMKNEGDGLQKYDEIIQINNEPIENLNENTVNNIINTPNEHLEFVVIRPPVKIKNMKSLEKNEQKDQKSNLKDEILPKLNLKLTTDMDVEGNICDTTEVDSFQMKSKSFKFMDTENLYLPLESAYQNPVSLDEKSTEGLEFYQAVIRYGPYGYGIRFELEKKGCTQRHIISNINNKSAASKAGVKVGDELIQLGDKLVKGLTHQEVKDLMLLNKGCDMKLTLVRSLKNIPIANENTNIVNPRVVCGHPQPNPRTTSISFDKEKEEDNINHSNDVFQDSLEKFIPTNIDEKEKCFGTSFYSSKNNISYNSEKIKEVSLKREDNGFGFSFVGGSTGKSFLPFYIQTIAIGGSAMKSKLIHSGDQIVEMNDAPLYGLTHQDVFKMVLSSGNELKLKILPK